MLQAGLQAAQQEAAAWQQNATAWTERLLNTHPAYRDLLQPVCLAVLELATGISMLAGAAAASHQSRNTAGLAEGVAQLMTPPELDSGTGQMLLLLFCSRGCALETHGAKMRMRLTLCSRWLIVCRVWSTAFVWHCVSTLAGD